MVQLVISTILDGCASTGDVLTNAAISRGFVCLLFVWLLFVCCLFTRSANNVLTISFNKMFQNNY